MRSNPGILSLSLTLTALLAPFSIGIARAQSPDHRHYVISVGAASNKVASGAIWLYSFSWYGLQKIQLATITNGLALVPLDVYRIKRELDPHPNTDGYVVALQIGEHMWYRTPDIAPNIIWAGISAAVDSLGVARALSARQTQLVLPAPVKRRLTLLYSDGHAAADADITLSIYLWDNNHCGVHEGLPLGTLRTDKTGTLEVLAPLLPLYLDGISYFHAVGNGPAGAAYSSNIGLKTGPEQNLVLKETWQLTDEDSLRDDFDLRVVTPAGQPRKDVDVWGNWLTNTCGGGDRIGRTDSNGSAQITLDPSFTHLDLMIGGPYVAGDPEARDKSRDLTDDELRELFSKHKLTVRW